MPAVSSVINLMDQMMLRIEQTIGFPENLYLFQNIFNAARAILPVIPAGLNQERARGNEACNITHIEILPQMRDIVA